jgi:hypothetical protein
LITPETTPPSIPTNPATAPAAGDTPTHSTTIHHDRRDDKEANERKKGSLPDDIDIHGVLQVLADSLFDTDIMTRS